MQMFIVYCCWMIVCAKEAIFENQRVRSGSGSQDALRMSHLTMDYNKVHTSSIYEHSSTGSSLAVLFRSHEHRAAASIFKFPNSNFLFFSLMFEHSSGHCCRVWGTRLELGHGLTAVPQGPGRRWQTGPTCRAVLLLSSFSSSRQSTT